MAPRSIEAGSQPLWKLALTRQSILGTFAVLLGFRLLIMGVQAYLDGAGGVLKTTLVFDVGQNPPQLVVPVAGYALVVGFILTISGLFTSAMFVTGLAFSSTEVLHLGSMHGRAIKLKTKTVSTWLLALCGILIVPTIFILAAAGQSMSVPTMLSESLRLATPIALGAMAGLWTERAGVVNIAIEGMMLFGACFGFLVLFTLARDTEMDINLILFLAVLAAVLTGGLISLLHAWLSITFKTDQIVSGTVINILALGVTSFARDQYLGSRDTGNQTLPRVEIPLLSDIPIIGNALFTNKPIFYLMFIVIIVTHVMLFHTRWGLRVRAVGEHPHAADTLGINVNRTRWINVFIGGMIAGLGGAWFSIETSGRFLSEMTSGRGFIALAALIFGKWTPIGAFGAALLFGFSDALGTRLQLLNVDVPVYFLQMVPYILTIIVLAGLIGRAMAPKAIGQPYEKE